MKLKVTYKTYGNRAVSTVIEVSVESIAGMLQGNILNEIYEKVGSKKKDVVKHGYVSKIEDLD